MAVQRARGETASLGRPHEVQDQEVPVLLDAGLRGARRQGEARLGRGLTQQVGTGEPRGVPQHQEGQGACQPRLLHAPGDARPRRDPWTGQDQRHVQGVRIEPLVIEPDPVSSQGLAVVGRERDRRVLERGVGEHARQGLVEVLHLTSVATR